MIQTIWKPSKWRFTQFEEPGIKTINVDKKTAKSYGMAFNLFRTIGPYVTHWRSQNLKMIKTNSLLFCFIHSKIDNLANFQGFMTSQYLSSSKG